MIRLSGLRPIALLLVSLLVFGCGESREVAVSYDGKKNRTTYKTKTHTVSNTTRLEMGLGSASAKAIAVRAVASCQGPNCIPSKVRLVFSVSGGAKFDLSGAGGELIADDLHVQWSSVEAGGRPSRGGSRFYTAKGVFATIDLDLDQLRKISTASSVEGTIGGRPLEFGSEVRSAFRGLLEEATGTASKRQISKNGT